MEGFSATPDRGWDTITRTIDASDYYVVLIAGRYGSIDAETGVSWTEREYEYAKSKNIAVLAFIRSSKEITKDKMDIDPKMQRSLEKFVGKLGRAHHYETWESSVDLSAKVAQAIAKQILDDEDRGNSPPGWYRGTAVLSPEAMEEFFRLSAENKQLRDLLATHAEAKPKLEIGGAGDDVLVDIRDRVTVAPDHDWSGWNDEETAEVKKYFNQLNSTFWIQFRVRNTGASSARNVVVDLACADAIDIVIGQLEKPRERSRMVAPIWRPFGQKSTSMSTRLTLTRKVRACDSA